MTQTFVKRQNTFDAIQFTGGEESAELVQQWLFENFDATSMYQRHSDRKDGSPRGEIVIMNRRATVRPGYWLTKDAYDGEFTMFTEAEFAKWFVPQKELEPVEVAEDSAVIDGGVIDSVPSFGVQLFPPTPGSSELADGLRGVAGPVTLNITYETTKHDEDTLRKVHAALTEMSHVGDQYATNIITKLQNAGILFRERI